MAGRTRGVVKDVLAGAAAGAVATWALDQVTSNLYDAEPAEARKREDRARGDTTAYAVAAQRAALATGHRLSRRNRDRAGTGIHWVLGIGAGAVYGVLRPRLRHADAIGGLAFGTLFWLLMDEGAVTALGLTPGPRKFPWQTHARGLAGHLAYGAVANTALAALAAAHATGAAAKDSGRAD